MKSIAIIQARMTSKRLPGKVMADLAGKPLLQRMIERVSRSRLLSKVVVATTQNSEDDPVAELGEKLDIDVFRGDENDVLGRIHAAAQVHDADPIVRLTADCPMSDPAVVDAALELFAKGKADYVSNCTRRTFPDGLDVEVMSFAALDEAHRNAQHAELREHVTPYIRGTRSDLAQGEFHRSELVVADDFGHFRFTVDTMADYEAVRHLFERLPDGFHWRDAVALATREFSQCPIMVPPAILEGLVCRRAEMDDASVLFRWLNERDRRETSLTTSEPVSWSDHVNWLTAYLEKCAGLLLIATHDGHSVGTYRLDPGHDNVMVSIYVDKMFRGRGAGQTMLKDAFTRAQTAWTGFPLEAKVRNSNLASLKLFRNAGFRDVETTGEVSLLRFSPGSGAEA